MSEPATYSSPIRVASRAYLDADLVLHLPALPPQMFAEHQDALLAALNRDLWTTKRDLRWKTSKRAFETDILEEYKGFSGFAALVADDV